MNRELKEYFLATVENALHQCLTPVPSVPLMELGEAVVRLADDLEADSRTMNADDRLVDIWKAANGIEWEFYPTENFGSQQATVNSAPLVVLAHALRSYREAEAAKLDTPLSTPHWEAATPAFMGVDP